MVAGHDRNKFQLTLRSKRTHTPEEIKNLLKEKVNLIEIKVGIQTIKPLRDDRVIIEVGSKKEIKLL